MFSTTLACVLSTDRQDGTAQPVASGLVGCGVPVSLRLGFSMGFPGISSHCYLADLADLANPSNFLKWSFSFIFQYFPLIVEWQFLVLLNHPWHQAGEGTGSMWHYRGPHQIEEDGGPGFADGWSPWHRQNGQALRDGDPIWIGVGVGQCRIKEFMSM